jgi:hypothetical protein
VCLWTSLSVIFIQVFNVAVGILVVIVLAIEPKVRGSNPAEDDAFLRVIKSAERLPSEGKEAVGPMSNILRNIEEYFGV